MQDWFVWPKILPKMSTTSAKCTGIYLCKDIRLGTLVFGKIKAVSVCVYVIGGSSFVVAQKTKATFKNSLNNVIL